MTRITWDDARELNALGEMLDQQFQMVYAQALQEVDTTGRVSAATGERLQALAEAHSRCTDAMIADQFMFEIELERLRPIMEPNPTITVQEAYALLAQRAQDTAEGDAS